MKNDNLKTILAEIAEQAAPTAEIDLWPGLQAQLAAGKRQSEKVSAGAETLFPQKIFLRRAALASIAVALAFALLLATPQGRAWAQSILQFFTRTPGDTLPVPTTQPLGWVDINTPETPRATITPLPDPASPAFSVDCGDSFAAKCSIEQIRSKVNFTVKELGTIPAGLYFIGATGGPDGVWIRYDSSDQSHGLGLSEERWTGKPVQGTSEVGASAVVEKVKIGDLTGEYYRGGFVMKAGDTVTIWDPNLGAETLRWVENDIAYTLQYSFSTQVSLGKEALVALAEGLTTSPVSARLPAMPTSTPDSELYTKAYPSHTLSLIEAEQQAGFALAKPGKLPDYLHFGGATYEQKEKIVSFVFVRDLEARLQGSANGLVLNQQVAPHPDDCKLCGILLGDNKAMEQDSFHMIVSAKSNLETVQIGALSGQYVEGHWIGSDCCGWIWTKEDIKTLRWWKNGMAFELSDLGSGITKADLIIIAENIK